MGLTRNRGLLLTLIIGVGACDGGAPAAKDGPDAKKEAAPEPPKEAAPAGIEWVTHKSPGGCTIQLPGKPKLEDVNVGGFDFHDASVSLPGRDVSVSLTWSDLPKHDVEVGDTEGMLDGAVHGLTKQSGGTLVGAPKLVSVEQHPGREFEVEAKVDGKPTKFRVRLYVIHDRLFRIVVRTGDKENFSAEADKLMASFALDPEFAKAHAEVVTFDWKPYSAPDGSFTAKFPVVAPTVITRKVKDIDVTTVVGSAANSYAVFSVGYYDEPVAKKQTEEEKFAALIDHCMAVTRTKLVGTPEAASLGKIAGRKFTLESEGGLMQIDGRAFLNGKRHFCIQAQRPRNSTVAQSELDTFLTGFVLGKTK